MKKLMILFVCTLALPFPGNAQQESDSAALEKAVSELDNAQTAEDYQKLEKTFIRIAVMNEKDWLPYYYAAFCNAKVGFLYEHEGERIEPFSERGEQQIRQASALLDTVKQRNELAEVYVVMSMIYRTKVFINPMTYGRKYGVLSQQYLDKAKNVDPDNPRVIYLDAWVKYYSPKMWGGNKKKARELAQEALRKLPETPSGTAPHWGKKECMELIDN